MAAEPGLQNGRIAGRYVLFDEVASGGLATVHIGRLLGPAGFARTVAIKRLHSDYAKDQEFVAMFLDEARLAARVQHPNVVSVLDIVALEDELLLVMEYVHGDSLSKLIRATNAAHETIPPRIVSSVMSGALSGLHAAHEATSDSGEHLGLVHRDVSPQNIMVGRDGVARVLDFGVAKATMRVQTTRAGILKGKIRYMAPEQIQSGPVDRRSDIFAAGVVLWEALTGQSLFDADDVGGTVYRILHDPVTPPSKVTRSVPRAVDEVVLRALGREPKDRFATARDMAAALERAVAPVSAREVGDWIDRIAGKTLATRAKRVVEIEKISTARLNAPAWLSPGASGTGSTILSGSVPPPSSRSSSEVTRPAIPVPPSPDLEVTRAANRSASIWAVAIGLGVLGVGIAVAFAVTGNSQGRGTTGAAPTQTAVSSTATELGDAGEGQIPASSQPEASSSVPEVATSAPASTVPDSAAPKVRHWGRPPPVVKPSGATPSATSVKPPRPAGCDPPYTLDADGTKHFKTECL
jgi:eukaryotic-like serine/threonine-protein kinase